MTKAERQGLEMIITHGRVSPGKVGWWSYEAERAVDDATAWIERQLKIDENRRAQRGKYRRAKR